MRLETKVTSAKARRRPIPRESLLETGNLPIAALAELACREGQATNPLFRVHRWFARRLPSQFRSILTGLTLPHDAAPEFWSRFYGVLDLRDRLVLDPFVGGGTSAAEAVRAGANFIGYDIDPVAAFITTSELSLAGDAGILATAPEIIGPAERALRRYHETQLDDGSTATVLHHFWVQLRSCSSCSTELELHPHYQLAYDAAKKRQWVFCRSCYAVRELSITRKSFACDDCGTRTRIFEAPAAGGEMCCTLCGEHEPIAAGIDETMPPRWKLFAQEYLADPKGRVRRFKAASDRDRELVDAAQRALRRTEKDHGRFAPTRSIPTYGRKDQRPLIHGFTTYRQLFNARQLLHLTLLGRAIRDLDGDKQQLKRLLALAFSDHLATNCMYTAYAFGYRRTSALFSIHGYRHITRPVELNPWLSGIGRGTFPNALRKIERAITFANAPGMLARSGGRARGGEERIHSSTVTANPDLVLGGRATAAVVAESSVALRKLPAKSVDVVLTDPPYFDNVAYSELSDFYLAWHQSLGITTPPYDAPDRAGPLAANMGLARRDAESTARYRRDLTQILSECRRVLRHDGVLAFTYHHDAAVAWEAVAYALNVAGFRCTGVLPLRGEGNGGLHSFEGTIKWDAVFVCRRARVTKAKTPLCVEPHDIDAAVVATAGYSKRLRRRAGVGFRAPDAQNLFRAMLVARARGSSTPSSIELTSALGLRFSELSRLAVTANNQR